ncbi:MAG TPA: flagellar hook-length control protein FliK [Methylibium sp.]|uniref:flagellar hook-length control protein FliK n=1 Tax=Methylibium sp. TaxID=2067992 RepID=UPI002DB9498F|nr:flagellar hook-length control protein FliK [Methylibium sp.]HEU4458609.1 flagellar hook-length control protein FliK [Methylibium sp.]
MKTPGIDAGLPTGFAATERGAARRDGGAAFAGLLDGERQRLDARAAAGERPSAFDAPKPANAEAARAEAAQAERRQLDARRAATQAAQRDDAAPRAAERSTPAQSKPGAEPTPPRAGQAPAKRIGQDEAKPGEARPEPAHDAAAEAEPASTAEARPAADQAGAASAAAPGMTPPADAGLRWSSTLALQRASEPDAAAAGDAAAPIGARAAAIAGAAGGATASDAGADAGSAQAAQAGPVQDIAAADGAPDTAAADARGGAADAPLAPAGRVESPPPPGTTPVAGTAPASIAAPAQASLPTPLDSPRFDQALGFQLASLVQDGVQQAELQLNPAEMGPVQVRIVLEGSQAQIDFAATQQRTREVLEASWPALAAAMHGAGFTLGGGGVFEQSSRQRDGEAAPRGGSRARAIAGMAGPEGPEAQPVRVALDGKRGLLDLYA